MFLIIFIETNVVCPIRINDFSIAIWFMIFKLGFKDLVLITFKFSCNTSTNTMHFIFFMLTKHHAIIIFLLLVNQIWVEINGIVLMKFIQFKRTKCPPNFQRFLRPVWIQNRLRVHHFNQSFFELQSDILMILTFYDHVLIICIVGVLCDKFESVFHVNCPESKDHDPILIISFWFYKFVVKSFENNAFVDVE